MVEAVEEETQRAVGKVVAQFASEVLGARGLAVLAKQSGIAQISVAAIRKITDQAMLAEIAKEHEETSVCVAAVEGITDSALLNHLDSLNFRGPDSYKVELAVAGRLLVPRLVEEIRQGKPLKLGTLTGRPSPQDSYAILSLTNTTAHPISFYVQGPGVRKSVTLDNRKIGMGKFVYFQDLPPGLYRIAVKGEPFTGEAITFYGEQRFESGFRYDLKMVKK